jgi:single-stranded DNA-binding protein
MNVVVLTGRLAQDPSASTRQDGTPICKFGLAVKRAYATTKNQVDFIDCFARGTLSEYVAKYAKKGMMCAVRGDIQTFEKLNKDTPAVKPAKGFIVSIDKFEVLSTKAEMKEYHNIAEVDNPMFSASKYNAQPEELNSSTMQAYTEDELPEIPF